MFVMILLTGAVMLFLSMDSAEYGALWEAGLYAVLCASGAVFLWAMA